MVSLMPVEPFKTILEAYGMHDFCTRSRGRHDDTGSFSKILKVMDDVPSNEW